MAQAQTFDAALAVSVADLSKTFTMHLQGGIVLPVVEGAEWPPPDQCDKYNLQDLCDVLRTTARNREVLLAVANSHAPGLDIFLKYIKDVKCVRVLAPARASPFHAREPTRFLFSPTLTACPLPPPPRTFSRTASPTS